MAQLQLTFLGGVGVRQDGAPIVDISVRKAQALLCYLAVNRQLFSREALAGLLWGEMPEANARMNLRRTLSRLRPFIGPHLSITTRDVGFNRDLPYWLDVEEFETAVSSKDNNQLQEAIGLYQGDFLDGFYVKNAPAFEEWMLAQRVRLRDMAVQALHTLVADCLQQNAFSEGITYANRLLALDPWREEAHRQLMELLARDGQRSAALMRYDTCRRILSEELGVDPSPATMTLFEQILGNQFDKAAPSLSSESNVTGDTNSSESVIRHNLPRQTTRFVGRKSELATLEGFLGDPDVRLVTIVGAGGMGKSRLALETAQRHLENFSHGVWLSSLAKLSSADEIVPATAQALHFNFYEGGTPRQQLLDYLRNKSLLLVMDNYEHLLEGADLVVDVLQTAPQVKILATSREPLRLVEEQLFPLSGLGFSREDISEEDEAVQFFLDRAYQLRPNLILKADDMAHITTICRQVEGMPLGLELAAAWADTLSLAEIAAELQGSLDLLESDMRNITDRHRSMRAVFEASWDWLQPVEQQLFTQLSVFRGGFTRTAAKEICALDLSRTAFHRLLAALTRKSFLKHGMENGRYDIHELMRQFGAEKLVQSPDQKEAVKDRHSSYFCSFLQEQDAKLKGPQQKEAVVEIEIEYENARSAWEWAVERERMDWLDQALDCLCRYYEWQWLKQDLEPICRLASEKLMSSASGDDLRVLARILAWQGRFLSDDSDRQLLHQSLAVLDSPELKEFDIRAEQAFALLRMGSMAPDSKEQMRLFNQSLSKYKELGDRWSEAEALERLAWADSKAGGYDQVIQWTEESLAIRQNLGDKLGIANSLRQLAIFARHQGQTEKSESLMRQSLNLLQELGNQPFIAGTLFSMAMTKGNNGQFIECQSILNEHIEMVNELGIRNSAALSYEHLGWAAIHLGNYAQAPEYLEIARSIYRELDSRYGQGLNLLDSCMIELAKEGYVESKNFSQKGLIIFQGIEHTYFTGFALAYLAYAERGLNNPDSSRQYVSKALNLTIQSSILEVLLEVLPPAALLLADQGKTERAIEIYSLAARRPYVANSQWFEDVAGQHVRAAAASLPPERVKAAEERGRARDFWETAKELLETDFVDTKIVEKPDSQRPMESDIVSQHVVESVTSESRFAQKSLVTTGGHGELYLGEDTTTGQQVIIKRLKPELVAQHPEIVARFIREGEALRQLNHPNIVKMLAVEDRDGEYLIVMEYVPGGSLRELLDIDDQLTVRHVLDISLELADALTRAHHLGIIHRDIKPANVLLAANGTPRLTDFGIAHLSQRETRLTQAGSFMGSPVYMSPEACRGETLDFGSDVWSFGVLLYEMLAGRPPFVTEQIAATLVSILNDPVPNLDQFRSDVPTKLIILINSMLRKKQEERINSVRQVAAELEVIRNSLNKWTSPS